MAGSKSPDAYRTISEAAEEAGLPAHVLRFWETKFSQLKPVKRAGGRRFYRPQDVNLLKGLKQLLHEEGLTIKGAQKYLKDHGVSAVSAIGDGRQDGSLSVEPPSQSETRDAEESRTEPAMFADVTRETDAGSVRQAGIPRDKIAGLVERLETVKSRLDRVIAD